MKKNIEQNKDVAEVSDLYFAAFLKTADCEMLGMKLDGRRVIFLFKKTDYYDELNNEFFMEKGSVPPAKYAANIRSLKSAVHAFMQRAAENASK
jgi:hypothetical protein